MDTSSPLMKDLLAAKSKNTILLNVGKWEIRKGHDILVDAFNDAFTNDSNVELWMCCENVFLTPEETATFHDKYKKSPLGHKIRILPRLTGQRDLAIIMGLADVGVFPVRGEGWNLEALEMLSCGKHVIASDYSAHQEFLNNENADLIKVESLEPAYDGKWFFGQGEWAHLDMNFYDSLVQSLRNSLNKRDTFNKKGIETAINYSWDNAANLLIQSLS
jgi:glycosyltransferase involved in cell wall biosynthesis